MNDGVPAASITAPTSITITTAMIESITPDSEDYDDDSVESTVNKVITSLTKEAEAWNRRLNSCRPSRRNSTAATATATRTRIHMHGDHDRTTATISTYTATMIERQQQSVVVKGLQ